MLRKPGIIIIIALLAVTSVLFLYLYSGKLLRFGKTAEGKNHTKKVSITKTGNNESSSKDKIPDPPVIKTPFADGNKVSFTELNDEMSRQIKKIANSPNLKEEYREFTAKNKLPVLEKLYLEFVRAKILFEVSRDCGLWHIQWDITNREPNSDNIWAQWKKLTGKDFTRKVTAVAECDEISALFAFLCKKQGVSGTGLFWPTNNHTIAVWKLRSTEGKEIRIVVPTTQIFLQNRGLFGKTKFDPWKQPAIYDYTRDDIPDSYLIPAGLANFFIIQMEKYGGASEEVLHYLRNMRESVLLGYISPQNAIKEITAIRNEYLEDILRQKSENPDTADIRSSYDDIYAMDYFLKDFLEKKR